MSSSTSQKIGAIVMLVGIAVGMLLLVGSARLGSSLPGVINLGENYGSSTPASQVCDLTGTIQGNVHDDNFSPDKHVDINSINVAVAAGSCHQKGIGDLFGGLFDIANLPKGAALGAGTVDITINLYNSFGEQVSTKKFTVTTDNFQIDKPFNEPIGIRGVTKGQSYTFKVFTSWSPDTAIYAKNVTI